MPQSARIKMSIFGMLTAIFCLPIVHAQIKSGVNADPNFYVIVENKTAHDVKMRYRQHVGESYLQPVLADNSYLRGHQQSLTYGVVFPRLVPEDSFDMIVTGKQDCTFTVGFYAPNNPSILMQGPGCLGGGYSINAKARSIILYVTDLAK